MFNDSLIVSTALSSFNNAALYAPYFFISGLLCAPLFFMVYLYSDDFSRKFAWNKTPDSHVMFFSGLIFILWIMLFGGNYAVIRDGISVLPVSIAALLFCFTTATTQKAVQLKYTSKIRNKKIKWLIFFGLVLMAALSGFRTWWGILLQISAILCGMIVGSRIKTNLQLNPVYILLFFFATVLVLMQPEYFRFGQLGNLTIIHLLGMIITGFFAITALVTKYINSRGKIHNSAYIKLKWLFRITSILAFALFIMTESVPVFLGLIISIGLLESLSIYHSKHIANKISFQSCGLLLFMFGIIIICPVISALGIIYIATTSPQIATKEYLRLL